MPALTALPCAPAARIATRAESRLVRGVLRHKVREDFLAAEVRRRLGLPRSCPDRRTTSEYVARRDRHVEAAQGLLRQLVIGLWGEAPRCVLVDDEAWTVVELSPGRFTLRAIPAR